MNEVAQFAWEIFDPRIERFRRVGEATVGDLLDRATSGYAVDYLSSIEPDGQYIVLNVRNGRSIEGVCVRKATTGAARFAVAQ